MNGANMHGCMEQIFACPPMQAIFDKIYIVDLASKCCEEYSPDGVFLNSQGYGDWLIAQAEMMFKSDAAAFFVQMNLKHITTSIEKVTSRYVVAYRLAENHCEREFRLQICYADEQRTQLLFLLQEILKDEIRPLKTMGELAHSNRRFLSLSNYAVEDFVEVNVQTGKYCRFSERSDREDCGSYQEQVRWWGENRIAPEEREAYFEEYTLARLIKNLRANHGYHSAIYTVVSEIARSSFLINSVLVKEAYGKGQEYIFIYAQDVTQVKTQEMRNKQLVDISQQLLTLSQTEPVTGLYNRAACEKLIEEHLAFSGDGASGTMLFIDIDHFKDFNDQYGHQTGDFILKFLGKSMQDIFRSDDIVSRWGGDEFVIFMRDVCDQKMVVSRIARLRARLRQCKKDGRLLPITISIGGEVAASEMTVAVLFEHCDKALYQVKSQGRNSFLLYSGETSGC